MIEIYTDGACIGNGKPENVGGWSFVVIDGESLLHEKCEIEFNTTNNRQEVTAVLNALNYCYDNKIKNFVIYSDSQYTVNGFNDWMHSWEKKKWIRRSFSDNIHIPNSDLWKKMYSIWECFDTVDLRWVRGHNGNEWNEYADELITTEIEKLNVSRATF